MDFLNEINAKYMELEAEADRKLELAKVEEEKLMKIEAKATEIQTAAQKNQKNLSYEEALARNANLLKAVDMAKARLRSRSTFSPIEPILEKAIADYKREILGSAAPMAARQDPRETMHFADIEHYENEGNNIYETLQ